MQETMPPWQGYIFAAIGIVIAFLTPTLVRLNQRSVNRINKVIVPIQLNSMGIDQEMPDNLDNSVLGRWQRFCYWFCFLLVAAIFIAFGVGVVLSGGASHQVPAPR